MALIPANIAKSKGRSFGLWWFYGWMLFIVALIHALSLSSDQDALDIQAAAAGLRRKCPKCAEYVKREAKVCRFCGYDLTATLEAEAVTAQQQALDRRELQAAEARLEQARIDAQKQEERVREVERERTAPQRRRKAIVVTASVAVVAVVAWLLITVVIPATRYSSAVANIESGKFKQAAPVLASLGDYKDSRSLSYKARLGAARDLVDGGQDGEALAALLRLSEELARDPQAESPPMVAIRYEAALLAADAAGSVSGAAQSIGLYQTIVEEYGSLLDVSTARKALASAAYSQGMKLMEIGVAGDATKYLQISEDNGGYGDSRTKLAEAKRLRALQAQ